jgi:CRISPR-associated protein Cas6
MDASAPSAFVDVAFGVRGVTLPREHGAPLAAAIERALPCLAGNERFGAHLLKLAHGYAGNDLVSPRTRLVLRVPREMSEPVLMLAGAELDVAGHALAIGQGQVRELLPHGTLYSHFVAADALDEGAFLAAAEAELAGVGVHARAICGRWQSLPAHALVGCSLMLDGLSSSDSLCVLERGLGRHRSWGCGLFVPHKSTAAVGAPS